MKKKTINPAMPENAFARRALESIKEIDEEAARKKAEQLVSLREALGNIDERIRELGAQRSQVEEAIARITGRPPAQRRARLNHDEVRGRVLRWLAGHAGTWYQAADLQREFPELEGAASVGTFLKAAISEGAVKVDKAGGKRNTKYTTTV